MLISNSQILCLVPHKTSHAYSRLVKKSAAQVGISPLDMLIIEEPGGWLMKKGKTKFSWNESKREEFNALLELKKPKLVIVNSKASLGFITSQYTSLACCRGSVIFYKGIPCIVMDTLSKAKFIDWFGWVAMMDWTKASRWYTGKQRAEPAFQHSVCKTVAHVLELERLCEKAALIAMDIETSSTLISSISYTLIHGKTLQTVVVPIIYTCNSSGNYWASIDEIRVWESIKRINANNTPKVWQNGLYDNSYMLKYQMPVRNYFVDTLHLFHSIWTEAPKRLDFIASLFVDHYRYWKDEGVEDSKDDKDKSKLPNTREGYANYWRYNALDTHYTCLAAMELIRLINKPVLRWGRDNYNLELSLQSGPMLLMTGRGIRLNADVQEALTYKWQIQADNAESLLRTMVPIDDFNHKSPKQVATLVYDILKAEPIKRAPKRTTNETYLKLIQTQHPVLDVVIQAIFDAKKPANNVSKYGNRFKLCVKDRFAYQISAAGTETGRLASKAGPFWKGANIQNLPKAARCMLEPDPGYVLFEIDYAQSDAYFTAFTSQDPTFTKLMLSDKDTHCFHAAHFFKREYNEVLAGYQADEPWVTDGVVGIRQLTKRIVYGLNYLMGPATLFTTMGKKAVIAAAKALGHRGAHTWSDAKLISLCAQFAVDYAALYPWLNTSLQTALEQAQKHDANKYTVAFGRTRKFLGDLTDKATQRKFAAYIGQGGTAGNINKGLMNIWNHRLEQELGFELFTQVHDSIVGQIKYECLHNLPKVQKALENTCEIKGVKFVVPTDCSVGLGYGKRLMPYTPTLTIADIKEYDAAWHNEFYGYNN